MAIVTRHANAPFSSGETLAAADLEADFDTIYDEFNGSIDNANIKSGADINGSKLKNSSIPVGKIVASSITTAKLAASALPKSYTDALIGGTFTTSTSLTDITQCTDATLAAGATTDMVFVDITLSVDPQFSTGLLSKTLVLGFDVDGTPYDDLCQLYVVDNYGRTTFHAQYAVLAPSAGNLTIKPQHRVVSGGDTFTVTISSGVFRCWILPGL